MTLEGLDDLDRAILGELQRDARHASSGKIAESMGVSASTVRKRIQRLESEGIITGYHAMVDYERAGYPLEVLLFCTAPIPEREMAAESAIGIKGVVQVQEVATGDENLLVTAVAENTDELTAIAQQLAELGLNIGEEELVRGNELVTYHRFSSEASENGE